MRTFCGVLLILALGAGQGWAALGDTEASVLHQINCPVGVVVREYVSPAGKVFGVSWQGPFVPDMRQLLGSYFTHLQQYAQAQTAHHGGPLIIQKDDFVFSSGGHMRWYHGRAYVPSLMPTNVSAEVVR